MFGIFNYIDGEYILLRYSECEQTPRSYRKFNFPTKTYTHINEVCLPNIAYDSENIGKIYNPETETFS